MDADKRIQPEYRGALQIDIDSLQRVCTMRKPLYSLSPAPLPSYLVRCRALPQNTVELHTCVAGAFVRIACLPCLELCQEDSETILATPDGDKLGIAGQ